MHLSALWADTGMYEAERSVCIARGLHTELIESPGVRRWGEKEVQVSLCQSHTVRKQEAPGEEEEEV